MVDGPVFGFPDAGLLFCQIDLVATFCTGSPSRNPAAVSPFRDTRGLGVRSVYAPAAPAFIGNAATVSLRFVCHLPSERLVQHGRRPDAGSAELQGDILLRPGDLPDCLKRFESSAVEGRPTVFVGAARRSKLTHKRHRMSCLSVRRHRSSLGLL